MNPNFSQALAAEGAVIDGFCYSLFRQYSAGWYEPMALGQMEPIRRAGGFRFRSYCVPEDQDVLIPAYDTVEMQVHIVPGSYLWGFLALVDPSLRIKITEGATGIPLSAEFISGFGSIAFTPPGKPILLSQPRLIVDPGWINVEMANVLAAPSAVQLILLVAEPCTVIEDSNERCGR